MPSGKTAYSSIENFQKLNVVQMTYLRYIGLWALDSNSSVFSKCLYYVYSKLIITIMLVTTTNLFADLCSNFDDLSIVTDDGSILVGFMVALFKVLDTQIHRGQILRLIHETIDNCQQLCDFSIGDEGKILDKHLLFCRFIFYTFGASCIIFVNAFVFLVSLKNEELPFRMRCFVDTTKSPWHEIGYFMELCSISVGVTSILGIGTLYCNLSMLFAAQLEILNVRYRNCRSRHDPQSNRIIGQNFNTDDSVYHEISFRVDMNHDRDNYDSNEIREDFVEQFTRFVRCHRRLLIIINDFNEVFNMGTTSQLLLSTAMICLSSFQVISVTDHKLYKFLLYLTIALGQLFFICWMGNELIHQSEALARNQWFSGWNEALSAKTGRLLIPTMIFSQRILELKAGAFHVLSMDTFISIVRRAYSFFTLLNNMHREVDQ